VKVWRLSNALGTAVLMLVASLAGAILAVAFPQSRGWIAGGWLGLAGWRGWLWLWYPPRAYRAWGYRIDGKVLETRSGVWFQWIQLLPLSRLQHVDLYQGPLERYFGLASLVLHTAGTHNASLTIPGLAADQARRLRDHLVTLGGDDAV
jgi:membrane protein YdbS with pleckstrin-like domain